MGRVQRGRRCLGIGGRRAAPAVPEAACCWMRRAVRCSSAVTVGRGIRRGWMRMRASARVGSCCGSRTRGAGSASARTKAATRCWGGIAGKVRLPDLSFGVPADGGVDVPLAVAGAGDEVLDVAVPIGRGEAVMVTCADPAGLPQIVVGVRDACWAAAGRGQRVGQRGDAFHGGLRVEGHGPGGAVPVPGVVQRPPRPVGVGIQPQYGLAIRAGEDHAGHQRIVCGGPTEGPVQRHGDPGLVATAGEVTRSNTVLRCGFS
ncbi:hypothetical protein DC74_6201 [Streptomyces noursei]|nr:hypothetical protein DC74_6201 [Streptomyces noursei]